jgi:hypothetical protein
MARILLGLKNQIVAVEKVTRAGATTSLIIQAVNDHKKVAFFAPTHKIGEDTVKKAIALSQRKDANVLYIKANSVICKSLSIALAKNKRLQKVKWLMLPQKCSQCKYHKNPECELQRILLSENWDILVVTYHKLKALVFSEIHSETSQQLMAKITSADVGIFDEYTQGLLCLTPSVEISYKDSGNLSTLLWDTWSTILAPLLEFNVQAFMAGQSLKEGEGKQFDNPLSETDLQTLQGNFRGIWNKVINLTGKGYDTEFLQKLTQIACCEKLFIHKSAKGAITLKPLEPLEEGLSFINSFADNFANQGKQSILIDSHLPDFNLQEHFTAPLQKYPWGDPNNTNSWTAYFCDSRAYNYHSLHFQSTQEHLQTTITDICNYHSKGDESQLKDTLIVCMNILMANFVKKWKADGLIPKVPDDNITWYRSKLARGVKVEGNVQIMLCGPYIPLAAYHHKVMLAQSGGMGKAKAWDYAFRKSNMVSEFINSSARVKDPEGKRDSYIYCLGMTKQEVESFLDVKCNMYHNGSAQPPFIISPLTTGMKSADFLLATKIFEGRNEIAEPRTDLPFLMKLLKAKQYYVSKGQTEPVPLFQIFRDKTTDACRVFEKNEAWLKKAGLCIKTHNTGGKSIVIQDNKKLLLEYIAGSCCLENCIEISSP